MSSAPTDHVDVEAQDVSTDVDNASEASVADAPAQCDETAKSQGSRKEPTRAERRKHQLAVNRWMRLAIQLVFLVLAPGVFSAAFYGVKYLFTQIGLLEPIELTTFVVALIVMLVYTIVFGRFFCGYACSFGMLGDVVYQIAHAIFTRLSVRHPRIPEKVMRGLSQVKYAVLVVICLLCVFGVWSQIADFSPWVAFSGLVSGSLANVGIVAGVVLILIIVGMVFNERFFCRVLCPMGAVFSLMPVFGFSSFTRNKDRCAKKCGLCHASCPVEIWPDDDAFLYGECISCGRCASTCPVGNVNLVVVEAKATSDETSTEEDAVKEEHETRHLLRGNEVGTVIIKAAVLLILCWVLGLTRYLPAFSDLF